MVKNRDLIKKLLEFNMDAEVEILALNKAFPFTIAWGGAEGISKENSGSINFYIEDDEPVNINNDEPVNINNVEKGYVKWYENPADAHVAPLDVFEDGCYSFSNEDEEGSIEVYIVNVQD